MIKLIDKFVIGFAFDGDDVLMIQKTKPLWQAGRLNGVGGKIEAGETPLQAMMREFEEETNIYTFAEQWRHFGQMNFPDGDDVFVVHLFVTDLLETQVDDLVNDMTDEFVDWRQVTDMLEATPSSVIANVPMLVAAAQLHLNHSPEIFLTLEYRKDKSEYTD